MVRPISAIALAAAACSSFSLTSCSYLRNRARDAADVFTVTVGTGIGFGVQAGPIDTGLGFVMDLWGLRAGYLGKNQPGHFSWGVNMQLLVIGEDAGWRNPYVTSRAKEYRARCYLIALPEFVPGTKGLPPVHPFFTQLDVSVGLFGSLRLGFNPGELLDLVLGFTTLDIFADDTWIREPKDPESSVPPAETSKPLSTPPP